ncbi:two-component system regulatory protein YycI, partial [Priestia megaterium]
MDWNRTKTIFIFTFLILNIYLGYQIFKTHQEDQYSLFVESSVEEQLTSEGIEYKHLPVDVKEASSLNAKSKLFKDEDLKKLKEQKAALLEEKTIRSVLDKPFSVPEKNTKAKLSQFLKRYVLSGEDYELWNVNKEKKTVTFFQRYK